MADYTYTAGQTIRFGRKDTELIHLWDFGDGNTSSLSNPYHIYSSLGTYTATHTAYNTCGTCVGGTTHTVEIVSNLQTPSTADYKFQLGEEIHFNRQDTELTHLWDFGDGNTSTLPDLNYIYTIPGIYNITHTAYNICGTCVGGATHTVEILQAPGHLDTTSIPPGAKIFLDNVDTGLITPSIVPNLSPGTHTIKFTLAGYQDWTGTIGIVSQQTTTLNTTLQAIVCPISPKYEGNTVTLNATPKDGIGPYYVEFRKNGVIIDPSRLGGSNPILSAPENIQITRVYTLDDEDIRTASLGTIDFSVYIEDSCPTGFKTCTDACTISIGCISPVCNFQVT